MYIIYSHMHKYIHGYIIVSLNPNFFKNWLCFCVVPYPSSESMFGFIEIDLLKISWFAAF